MSIHEDFKPRCTILLCSAAAVRRNALCILGLLSTDETIGIYYEIILNPEWLVSVNREGETVIDLINI